MSFIADKIIKNIKPSITLAVESRAAELKAQGAPIISLGVGEPDFDTPRNIKDAAIDAINQGYTKYTPIGGYKDLRQAIIAKFKRENGLEFSLNQILVGSGAKQVIYNALAASLNLNEEVIIVAPYWVSYPEMVKMADAVPVIVQSNENFSLNISNIEKAITPNTKWLILNSPNNPSGIVYSYEELRSLADMLLNYPQVHILSDDIYEHLIYDNVKFHTIAAVEPKLKDRILTVNGVSKAYAMTGWRLGYCGGSEELIKAMITVQSQTTSNPCSIAQKAAQEALNGTQEFIKEHNQLLVQRRDETAKLLNQIKGLKCQVPQGAFYLMVDCTELFGKKTVEGKLINNSVDVASFLLEEAHVSVVAGSPFGAEGFFRVSYATSLENLKTACARIKKICEAIL